MNVVYSIALIFGTTLIHSVCTAGCIAWASRLVEGHWSMRNHANRVATLALLIFLMTFAAFLESALWAVFYLSVDALPTLGEALYFSMVTFTTLGYGDITLHERWRVLASIEAANGIILFGWTTAIIIAFVQRVFSIDQPAAIDS